MDLITKTIKKNSALIKTAGELHQSEKIPPDTYVLDLDMISHNARKLKIEADRVGLGTYICAKEPPRVLEGRTGERTLNNRSTRL